MGFLKPKTIETPAVAEPEPEEPAVELATAPPEEIKQQEARKRRQRRGKKRTVITGDLAPSIVGKKTLLG